jgi:hypothetical protein
MKDGNRLDVATNSVSRLGGSNKDRNWALVGGGAGMATQDLMRAHEVTIPSETLLHFKLEEPSRLQKS